MSTRTEADELEPSSWEPPPAAFLLVLIAGLAARVHALGSGELLADEGYTALLTARPLAVILGEAAADVHPPLSYGLIALSRTLMGSSAEWVLRLPSLLVSCVGLLAGGLAFRRLLSPRGALLALTLLAFNPLHLLCAQEARMYGLLGGLGALTLLAVQRWQSRSSARALAPVVLCLALAVHTHYFAWFLVLGLSLDARLAGGDRWSQWLKALLVLGALCLPWAVYAVPIKLASSYVGHEWRSPVDWAGTVPLSLAVGGVWMDGRIFYSGGHPLWWLPWLLMAGCSRLGAGEDADPVWRGGLAVVLPALVVCALLQPVVGELHWLARYLIALSPWFYLLLARCLERLTEPASPVIRAAVFSGLCLVLAAGGAGYATGTRAHFLREAVRGLPGGGTDDLLVSLDTGWSLTHYMGQVGKAGVPWVLLDPRDPEYGPGDWTLARASERDPIGTPGFAPHARVLEAARGPGAPERIWVVVTRFVMEERPKARDFLNSLGQGRTAVKVPVTKEEGGDLTLLLFQRGF